MSTLAPWQMTDPLGAPRSWTLPVTARGWARIGLLGFVLFAPWTTWLAVTGWLRVPVDFVLVALLALLPGLLRRLVARPLSLVAQHSEDVLLIAQLALIWLSWVLMSSHTGKSFNHAVSFTFVYAVYLMVFKRGWGTVGLTLDDLTRTALYATILAEGIVLIEWTLLNGAGIIIRDHMVLIDSVTNMTFYEQPFFKSVAGTAEEPSLLAFNLNALFPLGWYYLAHRAGPQRRWVVPAYVGLHLAALVATASSGGIGFFVIAYVAAQLIERNRVALARLGLVAGGGLLALALTLPLLSDSMLYRLEVFTEKVSSKVVFNHASAQMRSDAWTRGLDDFAASPLLGQGTAYGHEQYLMFGYQSVYVKMLAETGLVSTLLFMAFLGVVLVRMLRLAPPLRFYASLALIPVVLHWAIADCYYHISGWIVIALIQMVHTAGRDQVARAD